MDANMELLPTTNFDLITIGSGIIIGTRLPESMIAAAAFSVGKTVIQLDPNPFYGSHYSSLTLSHFTSFLHSQQTLNEKENEYDDDFELVHRPLYQVISQSSQQLITDDDKFNVDLSGPCVFLCADSMVDLIVRTGIHHCMEFESVGATFISDAEGSFTNVPGSRDANFGNPDLSLRDKCRFTIMFKTVKAYFDEDNDVEDKYRITEQELERPFSEFLERFDFSNKLKSIISHAIVFADTDNISTRRGIDRLILYYASIGRSASVKPNMDSTTKNI